MSFHSTKTSAAARHASVVLLLLGGSLVAWGQRAPAPAASSGPIPAIGAAGSDPDAASVEAQVESEQPQDISGMPASSVKLPTFGGGPQLFTYGLRVMQLGTSNSLQRTGSGGLQGITQFSGTTGLNRRWGRSRLQMSYNGSESLFTGGGNDTQLLSTHQGSFSAILAARRWSLNLSEFVSYAPSSTFGLAGLGGVGSSPMGFASSDLRSGWYPNDSVLTSGKRVDTTTVAEIGYQLSARSSLRASGGFGLLYFQGPSLNDSHQYNLGFGFDRILSRRSNVSLNYRFFRTTSTIGGVQTHSAYLGYGRQLTSRLGIQVSGGPELQEQNIPGVSNPVRWTGATSVLYQMQNSSLALSYSGGTVGGSGIYSGARNQTVQASLSRPVARFWGATLTGGYAENAGFGAFSKLRSQYGAIMVGRQQQGFGLSFNYQVQHQSLGSNCAGLACAAFSGWSHTFGLGLDWIFRPVRIG